MESSGSGYVNVSGGLITSHFISSMQGETVGYDLAHPATFRKLGDEDNVTLSQEDYEFNVQEAFENLKRRWDRYRPNLPHMIDEEVLKYWGKPFFDEFGFNITKTTKQFAISDKTKFSFSHRGWNPAVHLYPPVVHVVSYGQSFDLKAERGLPCSHDTVQAYLNMNEDKWALLFNGKFLRLIRDFHHTTVKGYVEFDIEAIFTYRLYSDFQILYRFLHVSRFTPVISGKKSDEEKPEIYLEEYFKHSQAAGESVGKDLRENVVEAITTLGNGFMDTKLREELKDNEEKCSAYYEEILKAIYRIIFLLYAEQRGLIGGHDTPGHDIYLENYSITALRNLATEKENDRHYLNDDHTDMWEGLLITFRMIREGAKELGIYPYNGMLFDVNETDYLAKHRCKNSSFLQAIRCLTLIRKEKSNISQIISYADLSVEEFGSVYESLLDYAPRVTSFEEEIGGKRFPANSFILDPRGSDRKSTGSYYTNPQLVQQLIKSALEPVIEDRLNRVSSNDPEEKRKALLSIKVCDSASGSGAFLIAACNRLGKELARIVSDEEIPPQDVEQNARREILLHCIYGVDVNPMAVELAKVSLWINAAVRDKPLNFLDHHIKCGNSLIGATPELMEKGIPSDAFTPVEGDDKKVASQFKKINTEQHKVRTLDSWKEDRKDKSRICSARFAALDDVDESDPNSVHLKKQKYSDLLANEIFYREKFLADLWTSAFFWKLDDQNAKVPTQGVFMGALKDIDSVDPDIRRTVEDLARKHRFFHWHVEFPDIFGKADPGFDCVLGNPPWEVLSLIEKEFFSEKEESIINSTKASDRKNLIKELCTKNPQLYQKYIQELRNISSSSKFIRLSSRFVLSAKGKLNTYALFTENNRNVINSSGSAGIIVPTGIATDSSTSELFSNLVTTSSLRSLFDFDNKMKWFPIHNSFKFCLLTISGRNVTPIPIDFVYYLQNIEGLADSNRHIVLKSDELIMMCPNTKNCPIFRNKRDAEIVKYIYKRVPILIKEEKKTGNIWNISFKQGLFNMTSDSEFFQSEDKLEKLGFELDGNRFVKNDEVFLPLYEGKMFMPYDHRFANVVITENAIRAGQQDFIDPKDKTNFDLVPMPRYWVDINEVDTRARTYHKWLLGFKNVTAPTNERTGIFSILPYAGVGHSIPLIFFNGIASIDICCFLSNISSFVFDYVTRNKMGGINLTYHIVKQLPVIPPECYDDNLINIISPKTVELTYTAWDLEPFAEDILAEIGPEKWNEWFPHNPLKDNKPQPFKWDTDRRFELKRELDAIYTHLYGISREDLEYILETFPIVKKNDIKVYGEFKTKEYVLNYYDQYEGKIEPVTCKVA